MAVSHLLLLILLMFRSASRTLGACRKSCGDQEIKYPFGIDQGCGDPKHQLYCEADVLKIKFRSGVRMAVSIEYTKHAIRIDSTRHFGDSIEESCDIYLDQDAYNISSNTMQICSTSLPDVFQVDSCAFQKELTQQFEPSLPSNCFNYTKKIPSSNANYGGSVVSALPPGAPPLSPLPATAWTYASLQWIIDSSHESECDACGKLGSCGYNVASKDFLCLCDNGKNQTKSCGASKKNTTGIIAGTSVGVVGLIAAAAVIGCCVVRRKQSKNKLATMSFGSARSRSYSTSTRSIPQYYENIGGLKSTRFTLKELQEATNNFSEEGRLGDGGFGTVYKGQLRDGRMVAVKKLNPWNAQGRHQFDTEVIILSQVTHPHLVRLFGCCTQGRELLLVYEFVANGTLADHLHDRPKGSYFLPWNLRLRIVLETAEALTYLHTVVSPPIYHRDVKSTNILVDENYHAKVGDFGLSRLVPSLELTHVTTAPQGTPGYLDPDYHQSYQLTDKSDVYSLGVVLLEIISSQRAVDMSRDRKEINLASLAVAKMKCGSLWDVVDRNLGAEKDETMVAVTVNMVAELALECLAAEKDDRPCMKSVTERLEMILGMADGGGNSKINDLESPTSVVAKWPHSDTTTPNDSVGSI